jgi:hypothetical protein
MKKTFILFCFVILIKNTFSQTYKTEIELNDLKKKEIIAFILEAYNNIEKNASIINISLKSSEDIKSLTNENNELKSNIVEIWKEINSIQASITDLTIEAKNKYKNDSILNTDILNVINMMKQNGYLLSDSISQTKTSITVENWFDLIQVGHKYMFQGSTLSYKKYNLDKETFKVIPTSNNFSIISDNSSNTKMDLDNKNFRTITEMERLSEDIFKFTFSDGSVYTNILGYNKDNFRGCYIMFNGKTEDSNIEMNFNYSPYSGLFADGMRLIAK